MDLAPRITFRDIERSDGLEAYIRRRAEKLDTFSQDIVSCAVVIEAPHRHKEHGRHNRVRIDLVLPGAELVADRCTDEGHSHDDAYAAIDDAFEHAGRILRHHSERRQAGRRRAANGAQEG
jgi:ribosomal subunit interface protein